MGCVNRNSKEFKALVRKHNVSSNTLELITHQYWLKTGSENQFPSDVYIQAQLGNTQYVWPGKYGRALWKRDFSHPFEAKNEHTLNKLYNIAKKFFPETALVCYKNEKGNYVLSVKQPVEKLSYSNIDFFNSEDVSHAKTLDLKLNKNQVYTIDKVEQLFQRFNSDRTSNALAKRVFDLAKTLGIQVHFNESLPFGTMGTYKNDNTITFKKSFMERDMLPDKKAAILLHETIHALTVYALADSTKNWKNMGQLQQFRKEMNDIYEEVKGRKELEGTYGITSVREFVAELANPVFRHKLQSLDGKKSLWTRILDAIRSFFGIANDSTYYNRAMNTLDKMFDAFDVDTYMRYNGVRNILKQGYLEHEWNFYNIEEAEMRKTVMDYYLSRVPLVKTLSSATQKKLAIAKEEAKNARQVFDYAQESDDTGNVQTEAVTRRAENFYKKYSDLLDGIPVIFSNNHGGKSFSAKFKTDAQLLADANKKQQMVIDFINGLSKDELVSEYNLIIQERNDYDMLHGTDKDRKNLEDSNKKSGPTTFYFRDGTDIESPFKPNDQQVDALNQMMDFVHSPETSMTLSGYAGTGKTSLMEIMAKAIQKTHKPVYFCATTNKAASVLDTRISNAGFHAITLNKLFGIQVEVDSSKTYNQKNLINKLKDVEIPYGSIVIIDEASMINEENYNILNRIAEDNRLKIIYVGDKAQLAPVNEKQVSKVFRNGDGRVIELTKVERTGDNAILEEATNLRNGKRLSGVSSFNKNGKGVAFVPKSNTESINNIITHYVEGLKQNANFFKILAYTNKAVAAYNNKVRSILGYDDNIPRVGEPMTGYSNWGYEYRTKTYRFINSESYKVTNVGKPTQKNIRMDGHNVTMEVIPITLEDPMGHKDTFDFMDIKGNTQNRAGAMELAQHKKILWDKAKFVQDKAKVPYLQAINELEKFLFVNDNINDEKGNVLQSKVIDFGYALTTHKSQGSTFTNVLVDDVDISSAKNSDNGIDMGSAVDLGLDASTTTDFTNAEMKSTEDVDLGDLGEDTFGTDNATSTQVADVKQQLEYVAVSRATDTVTVISDNVKKEDSPLNHLNNKSEETDSKSTEKTTEDLTPKASVPQNRVSGQNQYGWTQIARKEITDKLGENTTSIDMVEAGYKTRITRSATEAQKYNLSVGDVFKQYGKSSDGSTKKILTRVTAIYGKDDPRYLGNWYKEGWTDEGIDDIKRFKDGAQVIEFELVSNNSTTANVTNSGMISQSLQIAISSGNWTDSDINELNNLIDKVENGTVTYKRFPQEAARGFHQGGRINETASIILKGSGSTNQEKPLSVSERYERDKRQQPIQERIIEHWAKAVSTSHTQQWGRHTEAGKENYEVSSQGDKRFSALNAAFKPGTIIDGVDVGGKTIEYTYQHIIKKSNKGQAPADDSMLNAWYGYFEGSGSITDDFPNLPSTLVEKMGNASVGTYNLTKQDKEDISYYMGYLPLWQEWAKQNPNLIRELKENAKGKTLTDKFANTQVSQARALADIINASNTDILWFDNLESIIVGKKEIASGGEAKVFYNGNGTVTKLITTEYFITPQFALDRITLHNTLFPEAPLTLRGFGRNGNGEFVFVCDQPFIEGTTPSMQEIQNFMEKAGFKKSDKDSGNTYTNESIYLSDLHDENVIKTPQGNLVVIDADVRLNTPELQRGGTYKIDNSLENKENGTVSQRLSQKELGGSDRNLQKAEVLLTGRDDARNQGSEAAKRGVDEEVSSREAEEQLVESWAKAENLWHDDVDDELQKQYGDKVGHGSESWVYAKDGKTVIKSRSTTQFNSIQDAIESVILHNSLNPNTAYKLVGIGRSDGEFTLMLEQPYIEGREATQEEINGHMESLGFKKGKDKTNFYSDQYRYEDLKPANVIIDADGNFNVIDSDVYLRDATSVLDEFTPHTISLPGFEYWIEAQSDTMVDAEWKVSLLTDLDNQINVDNTPELNQDIVNRMKQILDAKSKEDIENPVTEQQKRTQRNLDEFEKLTKQIDNLLDSNTLTASEIRHTAEQIVNSISDTITDLQKKPGLAKQIFGDIVKTNLDFQKATRRQVVDTIGINNLIYRAKLLFDPKNNNYEYIDLMEQAWFITDNWDALMTLASDIFVANEGFGLRRDYDRGAWDTTDASVGYDNTDGLQDHDTIKETEGDEQEHWQVESRTIDVLNSMSAIVRQSLHECFLLDKDRKKILSKWGIPERVNPRDATNSILRWIQGSTSLEDMVNKLSAKQKDNPWISQLVTRLTDKTGNETDFQSQFYGVFAKAWQKYSIVVEEDGKYHTMDVNSRPALKEATDSIKAQFKIGEHPLFSSKGIKKSLLGNEDTIKPFDAFNLHKALHELESVNIELKHNNSLDQEKADIVAKNVSGVARILGYPVTEEMAQDAINVESINDMTDALFYMVKALDNEVKKQNQEAGTSNTHVYDPFVYRGENSIYSSLKKFLTPLTDKLEDTAVSAFYDSGKMYQSYVTPSYMTNLMNKFRSLEDKQYEEFLMEEYGNSEWFKFPQKNFMQRVRGGWRNEWLRLLAIDENARKVFDHKVELNFNKHNYMRNMSTPEYALSLITEYFSEHDSGKNIMVPAWFRVPMQSNKPSSEFIKFYSYRGTFAKDIITSNLYDMFLQEMSRIQTVRMRNLSEKDPEYIKNFDSNGLKFNFLPFLNNYLLDTDVAKANRTLLRDNDNTVSKDNERLHELINKKLDGEELTSEEEATLMTLTKKVIYTSTENRAQSILANWEQNGIIKAAKNIKNIGNDEATIKSNLENFIWNDFYASKCILQLTIGDIAFYKDAEDLQKRLAQLHAPGIRGNIYATDYNGNRVSDGKYRTFILKDFDEFTSNIIDNIAEIFDRKIAAAPEAEKEGLRILKENLIGENGAYRQINVTDAQGYSSPSSYRKKALIFGKWSRQAEDIYQKLLKGQYTYTDLETAFQPLKPFVYTHLKKDMGVANAPIHTENVPFQAKNSEYLLIMADAILQGENLSRPNLLRAVYRVMEESEKLNPTKGIDTVQFESAIKSGFQGKLDIVQFRTMPGGEEVAFNYMMDAIYKRNDDGTRSTEYNTDVFVHESSYDDYCLQQEVPAHFKEHDQSHGSQVRMIIPSDLDLYVDPNGDHNAEENKVYYEFDEPDGTHKKLTATEFRKEYEETIAANINQSIENLAFELHLKSEDKKERNIAISKILQREILGSPRYGINLLQACFVDRETGEFRIPKGDPIQAKRIEQLINSIIKNRINKQKIAGGPIVQVTNFGTSRHLHIRFKDKNGNLLPTKEEYETQNKPDAGHQTTTGSATDKFNARYGKAVKKKSYQEYCKENQAGIAYFEVFAPIWSNELFDMFSNPDGTIDIDAIEKLNPHLLEMIGYRIPTEDKYSSIPMKVVGFMPREAGDVIMQPYEMTTIDDSDHDVDKKYVMRKEIKIKRKRDGEVIKTIWDRIKNETPDETLLTEEERKKVFDDYKDQVRGLKLSQDAFSQGLSATLRQAYYNKPKPTKEQVVEFVKNPYTSKDLSAWHKRIWSIYKDVAYETQLPTQGKLYRDNKIIDMTWAVLTHERTADKILNPGGFDAPKRTGYMIEAFRKNAKSGLKWESLEKMSINKLKDACYTDKDLTWVDTQLQFYKQNSAAASLIGVFAVNKVAHATLESNGLSVAVDELCGEHGFIIAGFNFQGKMLIDSKYDINGNLIGKTLGSMVAASADAVKDPILNLMNINMTTANVFNAMLRLGMPFEDAALFMSQDVITRLLDEYNRRNLNSYESLYSLINEYLTEYAKQHDVNETSTLNTEELTKEELIEGLTPGSHGNTDYKTILHLQQLMSLADAMRNPTFATRFNSISSAVGPLIIDNLIVEHKIEKFMDSDENNTHFYDKDENPVDIETILDMHPVLRAFSKTVDIAKFMFTDMPTGSAGFRSILKSVPTSTSDKLYSDRDLLDKLANFYQSYLLVASGMIAPSELKNYIGNFPEWFTKQNFKEKYSDNALIQAIKLNVSKRTGIPYLEINATGMDTQQKELLSNAWIDLHKKDPVLSQRLFTYCFFRGGIGFTPKTFMSLVPIYVKERLSVERNGQKISYLDTYRNFPDVNPGVVFDQFVRNNWDNSKLAPMKGGKGTHYSIDLKAGRLTVTTKEDHSALSDVQYMRTKQNGQTYLWKLISNNEDAMTFVEVKPLGNNGEYIEMSTKDIISPFNLTRNAVTDNTTSDMKQPTPQESDAEGPVRRTETVETGSKKLAELVDGIMKTNPQATQQSALEVIERIKNQGYPNRYQGFLQNVFAHMGIQLDKDKVIDKFKEFC